MTYHCGSGEWQRQEYPIASDGGFSPFKQQYNKKSFFLFLPSHPHKCGSSALFIGVSRVRVGVRVELLPSHLPSHYPHTSGTGKYTVRVNLQNLTKVPEKYSYLVPTVQHRYTNSIAMLHYQYSYAGLLVQGCCTFGARMLHFYWHYYSKVFTPFFLFVDRQYQRRIKSSFFILLQQDLSMRV